MKPNRLKFFRLLWCSGIMLLALCGWRSALGEDFHAGFDAGPKSWKANFEKSRVKMLSHRRHPTLFVHGGASENFEFEAPAAGQFLQLEHKLPQARVFDELKLSLWVRSNRPGTALFLRVVFPHQIDPSTDNVLHTFLRGDTYTDTGRWQLLSCSPQQRQIDEQLRQIRARLPDTRIDAREAYVDRAYVTTQLNKGTTEFFLDELKLGPIVAAKTKTDVLQTAEEDAADRSPVEFRLDRLRVENRPFFPRIVPYHGELPETLSRTRANVVWLPHLEDGALIEGLRREGLWLTATPPRPAGTARNGIEPFEAKTKPVLFWNLGLQIPAEAKDALLAWKRQIQDADRRYQRPLLADVSGLERVYSKHVDMLGVSRFPVSSSLTPMQYREWLIQKRRTAQPGSFVWSWIQTEMNVPSRDGEAALRRPVIVEPGQMRLQTYSALAAGCRGVGFWKTGSLKSDDPGALERQLTLTQLNMELELLEPWLATGAVVEHVPFRVTQPGLNLGQRSLDFRGSKRGNEELKGLLGAYDNERKAGKRRGRELQATIIRSDYGKLVLPVWYGETAFFAPEQMAGNDATIVVLGPQSASAWEVSPTGIQNLESVPTTGGRKITIPRFNQTAAIILTSDQALIARIRRKVAQMAERSARTSIDLMRAKLDRVRRVDSELELLGVGQRDAPQLLAKATERLAKAENAFRVRQDFHGARQMSDDAGQLLRILQSAHWHRAVRSMASPTAGPYTVCFQTLPDHWRLMAALGRSQFRNDADILHSGDFEDPQAMIADGWKHTQNEMEGVKAAAELYTFNSGDNYVLRMVANPDVGREPPRVVDSRLVTVTTPALPVQAGQIVHVSGRVRILGPIAGSVDGVMLYDNQSGPRRALRWNQSSGWQSFQLLRAVERDSNFQLTIALTGLGEAQFDDIRVVPHSPRLRTAAADSPTASGRPEAGQRGLDLFPKLPKWSNPLPVIQKSLPKLENPIPRLNNALPGWNRFSPQTPVPTPDGASAPEARP